MSEKHTFPPPPRRTPSASPSSTPTPAASSKWKAIGKKAMDRSFVYIDKVGDLANKGAVKAGGSRFWPTTGDFLLEIEKCEKILRAFTVDGLTTDPSIRRKLPRVPTQLPTSVVREAIRGAAGICLFTSLRTGIAPIGGAGGSGVVMARLPDGSWSAPSAISPNNYSLGWMIGLDIFDALLIIRTQEALKTFYTHKVTLGGELAVAAGPVGAGGAIEAGIERSPVWSYVKTKGLYAGVELTGQVFVERFDENSTFYHWPGVKAGDILRGKVRRPHEARGLLSLLDDIDGVPGRSLREQSPFARYSSHTPASDVQGPATLQVETAFASCSHSPQLTPRRPSPAASSMAQSLSEASRPPAANFAVRPESPPLIDLSDKKV